MTGMNGVLTDCRHCIDGQAEFTLLADETEAEPSGEGEEITEVTGCHMHGDVQYCIADGSEYEVVEGQPEGSNLPASYDGCHSDGEDM